MVVKFNLKIMFKNSSFFPEHLGDAKYIIYIISIIINYNIIIINIIKKLNICLSNNNI